MLDINLFRTDKGGEPEIIRQSQRRRFADEKLVDTVIQLDTAWRQLQYEVEQLNKELNSLSKQVAALRKGTQQSDGNHDLDELSSRSRAIKQQIADAKKKAEGVQRQRDGLLLEIGNIVHDNVPVFSDEADNQVLREVGSKRPSEPWMCSHPELLTRLGLANLEAGQAVAGDRGYYLLGHGVLLNQALVNYALQFLVLKSFEPVHTPFFMAKDIMQECAQLSQFDQELYRVALDADKASALQPDLPTSRPASSSNLTAEVSGGSSSSSPGSSSSSSSDKYLIATSEQPLCALHRKGWFEAADLPLKYAGFSTCFRREVGSHGKDTLGIFRVHQFEKVEQFCITPPDGEQSWHMMQEMMGHAEEFYSSLGIPYRVVSLVSGALNKAAAMKHDLEAWFPASQTYRELVSCSNCTDYQARRLDIRMRMPKGATAPSSGKPRAAAPGSSSNAQQQLQPGSSSNAQQQQQPGSMHVHMLNSTLTATQRTLSCILENHQSREGVHIPEPLRPFMMGLDFLPFKQAGKKAGNAASKLLRTLPK